MKREIVIPGEQIDCLKIGRGCFEENGKFYSKFFGVIDRKEDNFVNILPLNGKYIPKVGDKIVGIIIDAQFSFFSVDINSPYKASLPLSETQNRFDYNNKLNVGDIIHANIIRITDDKSIQISMKNGAFRKLVGGIVIKIMPTKVPRLIGKNGSMIENINNKTNCKTTIGQNGFVFVSGENEKLCIEIIKYIDKNAHEDGLTNKINEMLGELNEK